MPRVRGWPALCHHPHLAGIARRQRVRASAEPPIAPHLSGDGPDSGSGQAASVAPLLRGSSKVGLGAGRLGGTLCRCPACAGMAFPMRWRSAPTQSMHPPLRGMGRACSPPRSRRAPMPPLARTGLIPATVQATFMLAATLSAVSFQLNLTAASLAIHATGLAARQACQRHR